nr:DUF1561 family protein [Leptospira sp. severe_002]
MSRWIVLLLVLLISLGVGYSYGVNPDVVPISSSDIPGAIIQRPTDKPKDKPIKIVIHDGGTFCRIIAVTSGCESSHIRIRTRSNQSSKMVIFKIAFVSIWIRGCGRNSKRASISDLMCGC